MEQVVKALQQFLTRDLLYILGGGSVILSTLLCFNIPIPIDLTNPQVIFYAGIAYVIGYVIQEFVSFTPILTTSHFEPNKFIRAIYKRFSNSDLATNPNIINLSAFLEIYPDLHERQIGQIERTITLKHVGATMGSNWLVSSIFLGLAAYSNPEKQMIFFALSSFFLGLFLIIMSWIKGAQQMHMFYLIDQNRHNQKIKRAENASS